MADDRRSFRRASSRAGAASLDRSFSLDGNISLTFSRQQSTLQRIASINEDPAKLAADVVSWCQATPALAAVLGDQGQVTAVPLSGGLCNDVWRIQSPCGDILVKRAQGFVRAASSVPLAIERQATEAAGLALGYACAPDAFPRFLHYDGTKNLLATEFLNGRRSLSEALLHGDVFPGMGPQVGSALGRLAAATSPAALGPEATEKLTTTVLASRTATMAMEEHVFYLPFDPAAPQNDWPDVLDDEVARLVHKDAKLMAELATLRRLYKEPGANKCLVHHDVWSGNILCTSTSTHIIDYEFGGWGPAAYDIGHALAHFVLCATVVRAYADNEAEGAEKGSISAAKRADQQAWLLDSVKQAYDAFTVALASATGGSGVPAAPLQDVLGFAGVVMIRWTIGQFNLPENLGVERNSPAFVDATRRAVRVGAALLRDRRSIRSVNEVAELARAELEDRPTKAQTGGRWWCCGA